MSLKDQAIATSGDYLQNWKVIDHNQEVTYFHILDPKTGYPLRSSNHTIASASVIASSCAIADGLATVAMMFPTVTEARAWLESVKEKHPEIEYWLATRHE